MPSGRIRFELDEELPIPVSCRMGNDATPRVILQKGAIVDDALVQALNDLTAECCGNTDP